MASLTIVSLLTVMTSSAGDSAATTASIGGDSRTEVASLHGSSELGWYAGLLVGSPAGIDLSWRFHDRLQWTTAFGWHNEDRGAWMGASDLLLLFPEAIGRVGQEGRLVLFTGLGGQIDYRHYEDTNLRYGGRVLFGLKYVFDNERYEAFGSVATGLYHKPRVRASLDTAFGLRIRL